jgi:hypothetical protein
LFRGRLQLSTLLAKTQSLTVTLRDVGLGAGQLSVYADDQNHQRKQVLTKKISSASEGTELAHFELPGWARRASAVYRGVDRAGEPVVIVQELALR